MTLLSLTHISCNFLCMPPPPLLLLFLTHTHTHGNSSCRWFYSHIWQQLELWAHLFQVETEWDSAAFILTLLYIYSLFNPLQQHNSQNPTPAGLSYLPPIQTEQSITLLFPSLCFLPLVTSLIFLPFVLLFFSFLSPSVFPLPFHFPPPL